MWQSIDIYQLRPGAFYATSVVSSGAPNRVPNQEVILGFQAP